MSEKNGSDDNSSRKEFLLRMYDQMFNDINRHISIIWQPITVLVGSFALLAAGMREIISIDIAVTFIILLVGWLIANIYDSAYWYNRNLVIIANIERQFLRKSDLRDIHYYFGKHRSKYSMLTHIRIQWYLGVFIGSLILLYHFLTQALETCPFILRPAIPFRLELLLPYVTGILIFFWLRHWRNHRIMSYAEFVKNSPGIEVDISGIDYGVGHPIDKGNKSQK
jgi:hypothetical protein